MLPRLWKQHFLVVELAAAFLAGAALTIWVLSYDGDATLDGVLKANRSAFYGALASIFGSLLGFIITAVSVVLGFSATERFALLRESEHYGTLWKVFMSTIRVLATSTAASLLALVLDRDAAPNSLMMSIVAFCAILTLLRLARCIWIMEKVVLLVTKNAPKPVA